MFIDFPVTSSTSIVYEFFLNESIQSYSRNSPNKFEVSTSEENAVSQLFL